MLLSSQGRIGQLEEDLNDERGSADRLMERLDKTKEQARSLTSPSHSVLARIHAFPQL